jgi:Putative beta-barrel porin 2
LQTETTFCLIARKAATTTLVWLGICLLIVQPRSARGEPSVEVTSEDATSSSADGKGAGLPPRIPFHVTVSVDGGYDDNISTGQDAQGSLFSTENVTLSYDLPTGQTRVHLLASAGYTYYFDASNTRSNDVNTNITLSVAYQSSARLSFAASVNAAYQTEPDFSSDVGPENQRANFFNTVDNVSVTYHWLSRFGTVTSYSFQLIKYDESSIGMLQDRVENTFGEQFQFSLSLRTNLVAEYRFEIIDYDTALLDSITHFVLAGVDHNLTEQVRLHVRAGETFRSYKDDENQADPYFEGSLSYANTDRSSLTWTVNYGLEEPNSTDASLRTTFRTGLRFQYGLTSRISSTAAIYYHHDENEGSTAPGSGSGFSQDSVDLSLGLAYTINNHFAVHVGYNHSEVSSGESTPDYSRNHYSAGLSFTY